MAAKAISNNQFRLTTKQQLSEYITDLAWSADELLAATTASGEVALWQQDRFEMLASASGYSLSCVGFSRDGSYLAVAGQQGEVTVWQLNLQGDCELVTKIQTEKAWIDTLSWHPDKNILAYAVNKQVFLWDADSKQEVTHFDFEDSSVFALAWRPQGDLIAASGHGGVKIWQLQDIDKKPYILEVPGASLHCAWSADGSYLASGNLDRTVSILHWDNPPPWLMQGFPSKVSQVAWFNYSNRDVVATTCQEGVIIWQRKSDNWENHVLNHEQTVKAIAVNDSLLASAGSDRSVQLWQGKKLLKSLKGASSAVSCLAWHSSGTYLAAGSTNGELLIWHSTSGRGFG